MKKIVSLSLAQYRMLGRAIRGDALPMSRYRTENRTVRALSVKGCFCTEQGFWMPTDFGKKVFACRGAFRPGDTVWDSASQEECSAYYRTLRYPTKDDTETVARLQARMRAAGELQEESPS